MKTTRLSSREFNQHVSRAKRAAGEGPVIITDRGEPAYVLMRFDAYRRLTKGEKSIVELLALPGLEGEEFDPPRIGDEVFRLIDLS
jgi:prevent-host-death family protein